MTNQIFSLPRFSDFIYKYLMENRKQLLLGAVSIIIFPIVMCCLIPYVRSSIYSSYSDRADPMWSVEMTLFNIYIPIMAFVLGAYMFSSLADKNRRIAMLMSPASNLEKFLGFFAIYILAGNILTIGSTFFADWIRVLIIPLYEPTAKVEPISLQTVLSMGFNIIPDDAIRFSGSNPKSIEYFRWSGYFLFSLWFSCLAVGQAFFALGSSVWPKNSFLKTALAGLLIIIVGSILFGTGFDFFSDLYHTDGIRRFSIAEHLGKEMIMGITWSITIVLTLFTYWLSYFRFKEIETINRW